MMSRVPNYYPDISRRLSQVLDEIGVNERTVNMRRHTRLLSENILTLNEKLVGYGTKNYCFGSQTEGTTTLGLNSDNDLLICYNNFHVIEDWNDWQQGELNFLMINDGTSPGYCRLQVLRPDNPEALEVLPHPNYFEYDDRGRVVLKNTFVHQIQSVKPERHGPAGFYKEVNADIVHAFSCKTWPLDATAWSDRYCAKKPHNIDLTRKSVQSGCFLVPTGHCASPNERLEWRISTSMAERYIMFNMNIIQIRCYVLLKMIIKTFIQPDFPDSISSYHCKTILMFSAENSHNKFWQGDKLLFFVGLCLKILQICIYTNDCPNYFISGNNLMAGRLALQTRQQLVVALEHIICNLDHAILMIEIDNVGDMLKDKCSYLQAPCNYVSSAQTHYKIFNNLFLSLMRSLLHNVSRMQSKMESNVKKTNFEHKSNIISLLSAYRTGDKLEREVVLLMMPSLCTRIGCLLASECIKQGQSISNEALKYFSFGIDSDVTSGRLKLASALYCAGDLERTDAVLCDVEERYNSHEIEPLCGCTSTICRKSPRKLPIDILHIENINSLRAYYAFEVLFARGEIHCVPQALQYEMFRCTDEEIALRDEVNENWMDFSVIDSLPFLYYLQYLTYGDLGRRMDKQRALVKLIETIMCEPRLFHRDTALNLLGQCMEQEHRLNDAFVCYRKSLQERQTHNVARWHIAILLAKIASHE